MNRTNNMIRNKKAYKKFTATFLAAIMVLTTLTTMMIFSAPVVKADREVCTPLTTKTFSGPTYPAEDYPNQEYGPDEGKNYWVTMDTEVTLTAVDCPDKDASGIAYIFYEIWWDSDFNGIIDEAYDTKVADEQISGDTVTFTFTEECLHLIKWYAVDVAGNVEETHYQYHRVDNTGPNQSITLGTPKLTDFYLHSNDNYYTVVGPNTPIYITSDDTHDDSKNCAVGSSFLTYIVNWGPEWNDWQYSRGPYTIYDGDPQDVDERAGIITVVEYIPESCWHQIHVWCEDELGNQGNERWLDFIADANGPSSTPEYIGPQMYIGDEHYVHCSTIKQVSTTDTGCIPGGAGTEYIYWKIQKITGPDTVKTIAEGTVYDGDEYNFNNGLAIVTGDHDQDHGEISIDISVLETCEHYIWFRATDYLGNNEILFHKEKVRVDCKPPITTKTIGTPQYDMGHWVTTDTLFELDAVDQEEPCAVGVKEINYRIGYDQDSSGEVEEDEFYPWVVVAGNHAEFYFAEECYHKLEWYAVDWFGNTEETHYQYHKVDNTPPLTTKTIGIPYFDYGYWVTTKSLFELDAVDLPPGCESGVEKICYHIGYDENQDEVFDESEFSDWICTSIDHVEFYMSEECYHKLEWYSIDNLGHIEETHVQYHRVDDTPPETTKEFYGPTCGPDNYYLTTDTTIVLTATDYNSPCAVGVWYIHYEIWWDSDNDGVVDTKLIDDNVYDDTVTFSFTEECLHEIIWYAVDYLGNTEETHYQQHRVDDTPPVTLKSFCGITYGDNNYWTTTNCAIFLDATDYTSPCDSGVTYIYYEIWWDSDNDNLVDTMVDSKTVYDTHAELYFTQECLHEIRWYAVDCLGNTEEMHYQLHRVDDTPPETIKTFKGPTYGENNFWLQDHGTTIILDATDKTYPCNVGVEYIHVELWRFFEEQWTQIFSQDIYDDHYEFTIDEDCLHEIIWYAVDYLGNTEETHYQQHRVDSQPPVTEKTIGTPQCYRGDYVTTHTLFELDSVDTEEPCAVGVKEIHYRIGYDANQDEVFDESEFYSWVVVAGNHAEFYFAEECYHKLEWYAVDYLGNTEETHYQYHRVDNSAPQTVKTFRGPTYGENNYWVTTDTYITLTSTDYPKQCAVGGVMLYWEVWWDSDNDDVVDTQVKVDILDSGDDFVTFRFLEECLHEIRWYAVDCLGNTEETQYQQHRVDDTPPETIKTFKGPTYG